MPNAFPDSSSDAPRPDLRAAKTALRDRLLTERNRLSPLEIGESARALATHVLALPEVRRAATLSLYVSVGPEPGTGLLLDELAGQGRRVLLPITRRTDHGLDLDWAPYAGAASLAPAGYGLLEPTTPALGYDSIATADVVLAPGLAVGPHGIRIGRGAGCYDKALARVPVGTFVCALLYPGEVGADVPAEAHDRAVSAAATADGVTRF